MRIIFSIVAVLGLFLVGFSVVEIRVANDYRARVIEIQHMIAAMDNDVEADAHRKGAVFTGQTLV